MRTLQQIAYSHRHDHDFEFQMGTSDSKGNPIAMCNDKKCTAIMYESGAIRYIND